MRHSGRSHLCICRASRSESSFYPCGRFGTGFRSQGYKFCIRCYIRSFYRKLWSSTTQDDSVCYNSSYSRFRSSILHNPSLYHSLGRFSRWDTRNPHQTGPPQPDRNSQPCPILHNQFSERRSQSQSFHRLCTQISYNHHHPSQLRTLAHRGMCTSHQTIYTSRNLEK